MSIAINTPLPENRLVPQGPVTSLDPQGDDECDAGDPRQAAQPGKLPVLLQPDVGDVVGDAGGDIPQRQDVEGTDIHARDVGGHDGGGVEAQRLEAVGGGGLGAEQTLLFLKAGWTLSARELSEPVEKMESRESRDT